MLGALDEEALIYFIYTTRPFKAIRSIGGLVTIFSTYLISFSRISLLSSSCYQWSYKPKKQTAFLFIIARRLYDLWALKFPGRGAVACNLLRLEPIFRLPHTLNDHTSQRNNTSIYHSATFIWPLGFEIPWQKCSSLQLAHIWLSSSTSGRHSRDPTRAEKQVRTGFYDIVFLPLDCC